jgi:hypothetical protein
MMYREPYFSVLLIFLLTQADSLHIAIGMNSIQLQKRICQLQQQMLELGRLHPGSISEQYNVCGTLQGPQRPTETRAVLPTQLYLARQKQHAFSAARTGRGDPRKGHQLQTATGASERLD